MDVLHQPRHHSLVLMEDATRNAALTDVVLLSTMANNNRILLHQPRHHSLVLMEDATR